MKYVPSLEKSFRPMIVELRKFKNRQLTLLPFVLKDKMGTVIDMI